MRDDTGHSSTRRDARSTIPAWGIAVALAAVASVSAAVVLAEDSRSTSVTSTARTRALDARQQQIEARDRARLARQQAPGATRLRLARPTVNGAAPPVD